MGPAGRRGGGGGGVPAAAAAFAAAAAAAAVATDDIWGPVCGGGTAGVNLRASKIRIWVKECCLAFDTPQVPKPS